MSNYATTAAYAASKALAVRGISVKRSHLSEIAAALLGYRTYAALTQDEHDLSQDYHLEDAEILVHNLSLAEDRIQQLGTLSVNSSSTVIAVCIDSLKASADGVSVYGGVNDFYDSHGRQALADAIYNDDDVADAMAESNASYPDEPYMADECPPTLDLWAATDEWVIEADGELTGEYDPDGDRMYNGHVMNCRGRLVYKKAGRAGLVFADCSGTAGADDSWRGPGDLDDELM